MNSEELEQSLRTEFESYLKNVVADMRQEVSEFQKMVETEFEKHRSQMDDAFRTFQDRFASEKALDEAFSESVTEHLRLARDEGARITATAIAEAEELEKDQRVSMDNSAVVGDIRDAIREISGKSTQSAILKSLVGHAAKFTPRGAFFIIKNEHLVGWRVFGTETNADDKSVREVFFPTGSDTILGEAVKQLDTVEGQFGVHTEDNLFLSRLDFGQPDRMYAIPLVVRERAVAVMYADYGNDGTNLNVEALESLVQVAGLTVEISASAKSSKSVESESETKSVEAPQAVEESVPQSAYTFEAPAVNESESYSEVAAADDDAYSIPETFETTSTYSFSETAESTESFDYSAPSSTMDYGSVEFESDSGFEYTPATDESVSDSEPAFEYTPVTEEEPSAEFETTSSWNAPASEEFESFSAPQYEISDETPEFSTASSDYEFESVSTGSGVEYETAPQYDASFTAAPSFETESFETESVPVAEPEPIVSAPAPVRSRLSERNVDLPIEVSDDERRLHNDARRFARLLVSEIKLYNEQKVKEGRDSSDLYEKLKEAIDRSREMYDKRVHPPVAARFDYFHYELVSNLAEGDETKLGATYPGSAV